MDGALRSAGRGLVQVPRIHLIGYDNVAGVNHAYVAWKLWHLSASSAKKLERKRPGATKRRDVSAWSENLLETKRLEPEIDGTKPKHLELDKFMCCEPENAWAYTRLEQENAGT